MNLMTFCVAGRKTFWFSFLLFLLLPVFSAGKGKEKDYFKIYREGDRVIWELSASLVGREWLLVNQIAAVGNGYYAQVGDMSGEPRILQLREREDGRMVLIQKAVMSKNAGSNMTGPPKAPREIADFQSEESGNGKALRLDITSWVVSDTGMVDGKLRTLILKIISHPDCMEIVGWRERKGGQVQASSCLFLMSGQLKQSFRIKGYCLRIYVYFFAIAFSSAYPPNH